MPISRAAFLLFPQMTLLDFVGPYDAVRRVRSMGIDPRFDWRIYGTEATVADEHGLAVTIDEVRPPAIDAELLIVPGGFGIDALRRDSIFLAWFREIVRGRTIASICSGSLLLGDIGLLEGKRATTHHSRFDMLGPLCREVVRNARVVDEGDVITSGGVTSGIDLGLHLVERFWGRDARIRIAKQMEVSL
jgi:cyclohexyl-isocyanide hydratase